AGARSCSPRRCWPGTGPTSPARRRSRWWRASATCRRWSARASWWTGWPASPRRQGWPGSGRRVRVNGEDAVSVRGGLLSRPEVVVELQLPVPHEALVRLGRPGADQRVAGRSERGPGVAHLGQGALLRTGAQLDLDLGDVRARREVDIAHLASGGVEGHQEPHRLRLARGPGHEERARAAAGGLPASLRFPSHRPGALAERGEEGEDSIGRGLEVLEVDVAHPHRRGRRRGGEGSGEKWGEGHDVDLRRGGERGPAPAVTSERAGSTAWKPRRSRSGRRAGGGGPGGRPRRGGPRPAATPPR